MITDRFKKIIINLIQNNYIIFFIYFFLIIFFLKDQISTININSFVSGDGLIELSIIKGFSEGQLFKYQDLGWPYIANWVNFVVLSINYLLFFLFGNFSPNVFFAANFFVILSYPIVFLITYYFTVGMFENKASAILCAFVFTFLPFHFWRANGHLQYIYYFNVPIIFYIFHNLFKQKFLFKKDYPLFIFLGLFGIYPSYFTILIFCFAIFYFFVNKKKQEIIYLIKGLLIIILFSFIVILPIIINVVSDEFSSVGIDRFLYETDLLSQNILNLVLPSHQHKISFLSNITNQYNNFSIKTEQINNSFGIIGSIGLLFLLINIIKNKKNNFNFFISCVGIFLIFFMIKGGLGIIFSFIISEKLRAINRVSIFLAFISIYYFFLITEKNKLVLQIFIFITPLIVYLDQLPKLDDKYFKKKEEIHKSREIFFKSIKKNFDKSIVYTYPKKKFPEAPQIYNEGYNTYLMPKVYNSGLVLDYGNFHKGTPINFYNQFANPKKNIDDFTFAKMLNCGYNSILIFKNAINIENDYFYKFVKNSFNVLENNEYLFVSLLKSKKDNNLNFLKLSDNNYECDRKNYFFLKGFYNLENDKNNKWHWSKDKSLLVIKDDSEFIKEKKINISLQSIKKNSLIIKLNKKTIKVLELNPGQIIDVNFQINNNMITNLISFEGKKQYYVSGDPRILSFRLINFKIITNH